MHLTYREFLLGKTRRTCCVTNERDKVSVPWLSIRRIATTLRRLTWRHQKHGEKKGHRHSTQSKELHHSLDCWMSPPLMISLIVLYWVAFFVDLVPWPKMWANKMVIAQKVPCFCRNCQGHGMYFPTSTTKPKSKEEPVQHLRYRNSYVEGPWELY
jgi:hypothetical protein